MNNLTENEVKALMSTEAYTNNNHADFKKTQEIVAQSWQNLYPDDDRNENPENYYTWYSRGDNKVRSSHAERHGQVFNWKNPPNGGHPGEDYNCRCLAIPYKPVISDDKKKKNLQKQIDEIQAVIDYKRGMIAIYEQTNKDIDSKLSKIKWNIAKIGAKGAVDGFEGVWENSENLSTILDEISNKPELFKNGLRLLSLIKKLRDATTGSLFMGAATGAIGTVTEEYKYTRQEREILLNTKQELKNFINTSKDDIIKLEDKKRKLQNKL